MSSDTATPPCADSEPALIEKPEHNYALYVYQKLPASEPSVLVNGYNGDSMDLVSDDPSEETYDFSLSILATDLTANEEIELRTHIKKKLVKGIGADSMVSSVNLQCSDEDSLSSVVQPNRHGCYHQVISQESKGLAVCFISKQEHGLELFQTELDKYANGLESMIDANFSNLETNVKAYLESWYNENILYLGRSIELLKVDLQYVICSALLNMKLDIENGTDRNRSDIQKLTQACCLGEMMTSPEHDNNASLTLGTQSEEVKSLTINLGCESEKFKNCLTTNFCSEWAETLVQASNSSPFCQRQIIENYKLKIIQDMNQLRRLMKQAETDHYALFKSYSFLKSSENVAVMLYQARNQSQNEQTGHVIAVLDHYLKSRT